MAQLSNFIKATFFYSSKKIFLSILLVPFAIVSNGNDARIEQLKNDLAKKELELSSISSEAVEKVKFVHSLLLVGSEIYSTLSRKLDAQEKIEFEEKIEALQDSIKDILDFKKNIREFNLDQFISESTDLNDKFEKFESLIILHSIENLFLKKLFIKLAKCLQELNNIGCELSELQNS